jgi:hypothetical protein
VQNDVVASYYAWYNRAKEKIDMRKFLFVVVFVCLSQVLFPQADSVARKLPPYVELSLEEIAADLEKMKQYQQVIRQTLDGMPEQIELAALLLAPGVLADEALVLAQDFRELVAQNISIQIEVAVLSSRVRELRAVFADGRTPPYDETYRTYRSIFSDSTTLRELTDRFHTDRSATWHRLRDFRQRIDGIIEGDTP